MRSININNTRMVSKLHCPILIARSAPTQLALTLAGDLGITVVGSVRVERFNFHTHPGRIYLCSGNKLCGQL